MSVVKIKKINFYILIVILLSSLFFGISVEAIEKDNPKDIIKNIKIDKNSEIELTPIDLVDNLHDLSPYNKKAKILTGKQEKYIIGEEDTLLDIARYFKLGYIEIIAANPGIDPWTPELGKEIIIPKEKMLPRGKQKGIVVNLAQMRLYIFGKNEDDVLSFPIGVGRAGLRTPKGVTSIVKKTKGPVWFPTKRMREEDPSLPVAVRAGPANPLGTNALYLGWPTFLIHGSNKPWAIGRRVSSGCMRMYPEDILDVYKDVDLKTRVTIVDQPILVGWDSGKLYLEANPSKTQGYALETGKNYIVEKMSDDIKDFITTTAGDNSNLIDWDLVKKIIIERKGYPIIIADKNNKIVLNKKKIKELKNKYNYN